MFILLRILVVCGFVQALFPVASWGQAGSAPDARTGRVLDPVQGAWQVEELDRSTTALAKQLDTQGSASVQAQLDLFRNERNTALVLGQGEIKASDERKLVALGEQLERSAPGSFEANMARYYLDLPSAKAYEALAKAQAIGPERPELLGPLLADAARRNDPSALKTQASALAKRGTVHPGLMRMADDLVLSVEQNAVLIVAGEMDAYPLWIRQYAEGKRQDLLIVDMRLLENAEYRQVIWKAVLAKGATPNNADAFLGAIGRSSERPIYLSLSLGKERLAPFERSTFPTGIALKYSTSPTPDMKLLEERWARFNKPTDAGPLSRNYLLPGSILLMHYRSIQDEAKAARMEFELRQFATSIGASKVLYTLGVLQH